MIMELKEEMIDDFLEALNAGNELFPKRLLKLLRRYFHYDHMIFMPCLYEKVYHETRKRHAAMDNYIGLNFRMADLQLYENYADYDPFTPAKLPAVLRDRYFLKIENVMSLAQYEKSEYYKFMSRIGFYYQGSMMLKNKAGRIMAGIGFFRKKEEGDFTEEEAELLTKIAKQVSSLYYYEILLSTSVQLFNMVEKIYSSSAMGVVLTDNRGMILWSNASARMIGKQFAREGSDMILGNMESFDDDIMDIQQVILDLDEELLGDEPCSYCPPLNRNYTFYSQPFRVANIMGTKAGRYLIHIHREVEKESEFDELISQLTKRERQILESLLQGKTNEEIAFQLSISENTIRTHISNIYKKLGVKNKSEVFLKFRDQ